jgi:hypothetical protein
MGRSSNVGKVQNLYFYISIVCVLRPTWLPVQFVQKDLSSGVKAAEA